MTKKITISLTQDLSEKLEAAAQETSKTESAVIRDVLVYFLDSWLEGERAKLQIFRQLTQPIQEKGRKQ